MQRLQHASADLCVGLQLVITHAALRRWGAATMKFRPCIDIHDGVVKQIVGGTLKDSTDGTSESPTTNFVATQPAEYFARMYAAESLSGGHVILLGKGDVNEVAALSALSAFRGGLQVGGGITPANARKYLDGGASHVIVTSYVFRDGRVDYDRLNELVETVGTDRLVLDLSCRKRSVPGESRFEYVVVTDRWQKWTDCVVDHATLHRLAAYCSEFLVHGVDVEGLRAGVEDDLISLLGTSSPIPVTYAGGVRDMDDVQRVTALGGGRVDVSVGSALDVFGGNFPFSSLVAWHKGQQGATASGAGGGEGAQSGAGAGFQGGVEHDVARRLFRVPAPKGGSADEDAILSYAILPADTHPCACEVMDIRRTWVPDVHRGKGVAGTLAGAAFQWAQGQGMWVKPSCSYIADSWLPKHGEYAHLIVTQ